MPILNGFNVPRIELADLTPGGVDGGGSMIDYRYGGRAETGWFTRAIGDGTLMVDTFSGDYGVVHWIGIEQIERVYSAAEVADMAAQNRRAEEAAWRARPGSR